MKFAPIKNEKEYQKALQELEKVFDADLNTPEGPITAPDPIEAIKSTMEEKGLSNKDVVSYFGSKSLVSQVLSKQRNLSLKMIKALHTGLRLPYEILLAE
jgi:HTH-type transcriptional regulator / antitoxin HigA